MMKMTQSKYINWVQRKELIKIKLIERKKER